MRAWTTAGATASTAVRRGASAAAAAAACLCPLAAPLLRAPAAACPPPCAPGQGRGPRRTACPSPWRCGACGRGRHWRWRAGGCPAAAAVAAVTAEATGSAPAPPGQPLAPLHLGPGAVPPALRHTIETGTAAQGSRGQSSSARGARPTARVGAPACVRAVPCDPWLVSTWSERRTASPQLKKVRRNSYYFPEILEELDRPKTARLDEVDAVESSTSPS